MAIARTVKTTIPSEGAEQRKEEIRRGLIAMRESDVRSGLSTALQPTAQAGLAGIRQKLEQMRSRGTLLSTGDEADRLATEASKGIKDTATRIAKKDEVYENTLREGARLLAQTNLAESKLNRLEESAGKQLKEAQAAEFTRFGSLGGSFEKQQRDDFNRDLAIQLGEIDLSTLGSINELETMLAGLRTQGLQRRAEAKQIQEAKQQDLLTQAANIGAMALTGAPSGPQGVSTLVRDIGAGVKGLFGTAPSTTKKRRLQRGDIFDSGISPFGQFG